MTAYRCQHLRAGTLAKHSTVRFDSVPDDENTTSYIAHDNFELCPLCSGFAFASLHRLLGGDPVRVGEGDD